MPQIAVVALIGSAVPEDLRRSGHQACWYVLVDGEPRLGPFLTSHEARSAKERCERELRSR